MHAHLWRFGLGLACMRGGDTREIACRRTFGGLGLGLRISFRTSASMGSSLAVTAEERYAGGEVSGSAACAASI